MEHHRAFRVRAFDMAPVKLDGAFGDLVETCRHGQHGGLAAAGMADEGDKLALVELKVEVLHHGKRAFRRRVDLVELGEVEEPFLDHALLRVFDGLWQTVDRGDVGQCLRAFDLGLDPHVHQVFRDVRAETLEAFVVVHLGPFARARDLNFELFAKRPVRVQRDDAVGEDDGFVHIVGDENAGLFLFGPNRLNLIGEVGAGERVESGKRFVQKQHLWVHRERARHVHPLTHPARKLCRAAGRGVAEAHHFHVMVDFRRPLRLWHLREDRVDREADIAVHRQPGHQRVALEDHAAFPARASDRFVFEEHFAGGRQIEPSHQIDEGRFPGAGEAEEDEELALLYA